VVSKWPNLQSYGDLVVSHALPTQVLFPLVSMKNAAQLWRDYHAASNNGNTQLARQILQSLKSYSGNPPPKRGGCAKCNRQFY
jgi:hypothetical protein